MTDPDQAVGSCGEFLKERNRESTQIVSHEGIRPIRWKFEFEGETYLGEYAT
jgi:hypothetical protein